MIDTSTVRLRIRKIVAAIFMRITAFTISIVFPVHFVNGFKSHRPFFFNRKFHIENGDGGGN